VNGRRCGRRLVGDLDAEWVPQFQHFAQVAPEKLRVAFDGADELEGWFFENEPGRRLTDGAEAELNNAQGSAHGVVVATMRRRFNDNSSAARRPAAGSRSS